MNRTSDAPEPPLAAAAAARLLPALALPFPRLRRSLGVVDRTRPGPHVALTFDDGPHPRGTPAVLDALARGRALATYFLVGERLETTAGLGAEIVAAGHEIGVHGYRHRNLVRLTPRETEADLLRGADAVARATGREPRLYRPPYGILTPAALDVARREGWQVVLWTRWGRDWSRRSTPATIAGRLLCAIAPGDVLLLHDSDSYSAPGSWRRTATAVPLVLEGLRRLGLGTTTLP